MPRNGSGVFSYSSGSTATTGDTATASTHNIPLDDLKTDANAARPIVAGGTGATTADGARKNLGVPKFSTRAAAVTWIGSNSVDDGVILMAAGLGYQASSGATKIADMPGFVPMALARAEPQHHGVAVGSTDYQTEMDKWLTNACAGDWSGISQAGAYTIGGVIASTIDADVDVKICPGAVITAASGFTANNKMIQFNDGGTGSDHVFKWVGGAYNCENQPNSGAGQANDIFYFTAQNTASVQIHLDDCYGGADYRTSGGDSFIFCTANNVDIKIGRAHGAVDVGVYLSGDSTDSTYGTRAKVRGNFIKCQNAVLAKRQFEDVDIRVFVEDCLNGVGYADDASVGGTETEGGHGGIIDVTSRRTQRTCTIQGGGNVTCRVNAIDIGLSLTGGTPVLSTGAQGLYLSGCTGVKGEVNVQGINDACTLSNNFIAVRCDERSIDSTTYQATDNMVSVLARDVGKAVSEENSCDRNVFIVNEDGNNSEPSLVGGDSHITKHEDGRQLVGFGAVPGNPTTDTVREESSGTAQFLEAKISDNGWQLLIKDASGNIAGRALYSHSSDTWTFRTDNNERFFINPAGPAAPQFTVANLPTTGRTVGTFVMATDGRKNGEGASSGSGVLCFYDGTDWIAVDSGQAVQA